MLCFGTAMSLLSASLVNLGMTVGITVAFVAVLMAAMAVGVIFSNRRLAGSCGGTGLDCVCEKKERGECPHAEDGEAVAAEKLVPGGRLVRHSTEPLG